MKMVLRSGSRRLHRFRRKETGGVLIEGVLWLPLMFWLFVLAADLSVLFMNQARIKSMMQEAGRRMAVGSLEECADLEEWLNGQVQLISPTAVSECDETQTVSRIRVSAPAGELDLTGSTGLFGGITVNVQVLYHQEVG
jgi:Flp pilus assembly protein TadG